jgi:hypothetical protein
MTICGMSAFAVVIGGKADLVCCTAYVPKADTASAPHMSVWGVKRTPHRGTSIPAHLKCGAVTLTFGLAFFFPPSKLGE